MFHHLDLGLCSDFDKNDSPWLIYWNVWSLVCKTVWGRIRKYGLVGGGVTLEGEFSKAHPMPSLSLSLPAACRRDVNAQLLLPWHACLSVVMFPP